MRLTKTIVIGALCATIAAAAGIASGAASSGSKKHRTTNNSSTTPGPLGIRKVLFGGPPVHSESVVLNQAGTAWITMTEDNGKVASVSGDQLTITEGTDKVPYKTVTLTIPSDATIIRNGQKASLSDFKAGDFVHVSQSSDGTLVIGGDMTQVRKFKGGPGPGFHFKGGPGGPGGPHFGPPPFAAPGYGSGSGSGSGTPDNGSGSSDNGSGSSDNSQTTS